MVHSAVSVENEFFCLAKDEDKSITNMKFQKLPYIAHNWSLALLKSTFNFFTCMSNIL